MLLTFGLLVACKGKYADMSFEEIQAMARRLPLAERYDFYLEVRGNSRLPPNDQVKYDIVAWAIRRGDIRSGGRCAIQAN
nr:hypothetical protein [Sphingomonas sp. Y57]